MSTHWTDAELSILKEMSARPDYSHYQAQQAIHMIGRRRSISSIATKRRNMGLCDKRSAGNSQGFTFTAQHKQFIDSFDQRYSNADIVERFEAKFGYLVTTAHISYNRTIKRDPRQPLYSWSPEAIEAIKSIYWEGIPWQDVRAALLKIGVDKNYSQISHCIKKLYPGHRRTQQRGTYKKVEKILSPEIRRRLAVYDAVSKRDAQVVMPNRVYWRCEYDDDEMMFSLENMYIAPLRDGRSSHFYLDTLR